MLIHDKLVSKCPCGRLICADQTICDLCRDDLLPPAPTRWDMADRHSYARAPLIGNREVGTGHGHTGFRHGHKRSTSGPDAI